MAFLIMPSTLSVEEVPVVLARYIALPRPGVMQRPTVETPMGKL